MLNLDCSLFQVVLIIAISKRANGTAGTAFTEQGRTRKKKEKSRLMRRADVPSIFHVYVDLRKSVNASAGCSRARDMFSADVPAGSLCRSVAHPSQGNFVEKHRRFLVESGLDVAWSVMWLAST
eukprot:Nk52_evm1s2405 gene=Nk52_evmTU1s2405